MDGQDGPRQEAAERALPEGRRAVASDAGGERPKTQQEEARELSKKQKEQAERGFADVKGHRDLRRLSGRGGALAQTQLGLVCLAHNVVLFAKFLHQRESTNHARQPQ